MRHIPTGKHEKRAHNVHTPRQRDRVVKVMDWKSIGLCPQGFESPRCRCWYPTYTLCHAGAFGGHRAMVPEASSAYVAARPRNSWCARQPNRLHRERDVCNVVGAPACLIGLCENAARGRRAFSHVMQHAICQGTLPERSAVSRSSTIVRRLLGAQIPSVSYVQPRRLRCHIPMQKLLRAARCAMRAEADRACRLKRRSRRALRA